MDNRPIGIFDSGLGGLTVVKEIAKELPNEKIIYLGDTARFPYGSKTKEELKKITSENIRYLLTHDVKFVIIACNSASSAALKSAQAVFDIPIMGVIEPGARAAVQLTNTRKVGVIGTQATISSCSYELAVKNLDVGIEVFCGACPGLADYVENNALDHEDLESLLRKHLGPLLKENIDSLILGCTHYPLLIESITKITGKEIKLISSAKEASKDLHSHLKRKGTLRKILKKPIHKFHSSGDPEIFRDLGEIFLGEKIDTVAKALFQYNKVNK